MNEASAAALTDGESAIVDGANAVMVGGLAFTTLDTAMAHEDYDYQISLDDSIVHKYPKFDGITWKDYGDTFEEALYNFHHGKKKKKKACP